MDEKDKWLFLKDFVKNEIAVRELLGYTKNKFINTNKAQYNFDNQSINTWISYYKESRTIGTFETLKKYFVQLQYPIKKGISQTEEYRNATLKGKQKQSKENLVLKQPDRITLEIYNSDMTGKTPILLVPDNDDFQSIICALSNKNEPKELPNAMGAICIKGINNWQRINQLKKDWLQNNPLGNWGNEFKNNILPNPYMFRDQLIVLSAKAYSGVRHSQIGMIENSWKSLSIIIRREHECAHLFTLQYYGIMANNIHDEIVADYAGITKASGRFNKEWFLHFMGLENYPNYRKGGRLENYLGTKGLSKEAFDGLKTIIYNIADNISKFDEFLGYIENSTDQLTRIICICELDLISMASSQAVEKLLETYQTLDKETTQ